MDISLTKMLRGSFRELGPYLVGRGVEIYIQEPKYIRLLYKGILVEYRSNRVRNYPPKEEKDYGDRFTIIDICPWNQFSKNTGKIENWAEDEWSVTVCDTQ